MKTKASVIVNKRVASSVQASMAFEGLKPSVYAQRIGELYLESKISSHDARTKIRAKHASKFGK